MMAQTGPFSVPVRCRRKRCAVSMYLQYKHSATLTGLHVASHSHITPVLCTG